MLDERLLQWFRENTMRVGTKDMAMWIEEKKPIEDIFSSPMRTIKILHLQVNDEIDL